MHARKQTKTERLNHYHLQDAFRMIEHDIVSGLYYMRGLPQDWHDIAHDTDRRDRTTTRVTVRLDSDVVKFFKALGPGYQPRMNRVLRAFMHARLAKIVEGPDTTDFVCHPERLPDPGPRPSWGEAEAMVAEARRFVEDEG